MEKEMDRQAPKTVVPAIMVILTLLVIATGWTLTTRLGDSKAVRVATSQPAEPEAGSQVQVATTISYHGENGKTALEILKTTEDVVVHNSQIDNINGQKSGTDGKYWVFYVNGKLAQTNAGKYNTKDSDFIEWKFE